MNHFMIKLQSSSKTFYLVRDGKNDFWTLDKVNGTVYSNKEAAEAGRQATKEFMTDKLDVWARSEVVPA